MNNYSDLYLLPFPKNKLKKYIEIASRFGTMCREYGALDYREFVGDDLSPKGVLSFKKAVTLKKNDIVIAAVVDFKSRVHRDQVMKKIFKDSRMVEFMKETELTDMSRMYYGGFKVIVKK